MKAHSTETPPFMDVYASHIFLLGIDVTYRVAYGFLNPERSLSIPGFSGDPDLKSFHAGTDHSDF